jgi:hypothetical protein
MGAGNIRTNISKIISDKTWKSFHSVVEYKYK